MDDEIDLALPNRRCASSAFVAAWLVGLLAALPKLPDLHDTLGSALQAKRQCLQMQAKHTFDA